MPSNSVSDFIGSFGNDTPSAEATSPKRPTWFTDFATVQYFGVQTVSVGVYLVWKGSFDFQSASQLSVLVLMFAVPVWKFAPVDPMTLRRVEETTTLFLLTLPVAAGLKV